MTPAACIKAAFTRAIGRRALVHFLRISTDPITMASAAVYSVNSSAAVDTAYTVMVHPGGYYSCDCPGGLRTACWHRTAVYNLRASREAFGLDPAPLPAWMAEGAASLKRRLAAGSRLAAIAELVS
jgi:hypothetical protein